MKKPEVILKKSMTLLGVLVFVMGVYAQEVPPKDKTPKGKKEKVDAVKPVSEDQSDIHGVPSWAPAEGYRAKTRHIYFPKYDFYFDLRKNMYIYLNVGTWKTSAELPSTFVGVDLKQAAKIELDLDTDQPQKDNAQHKKMMKVDQR